MRRSGVRMWAIPGLVILLAILAPRIASPVGRDGKSGGPGEAPANVVVAGGESPRTPLRFLSVAGAREASPGAEALYHVVLLFPSAAITDLGTSADGDDEHRAVDARWRVDAGGRAVEMAFRAEYDAEWGTVTIAGAPYSLADGNVFVVRPGDGAEAGVRQIDAAVAGMDDLDAVKDAASTLRDDAEVLRAMGKARAADPRT